MPGCSSLQGTEWKWLGKNQFSLALVSYSQKTASPAYIKSCLQIVCPGARAPTLVAGQGISQTNQTGRGRVGCVLSPQALCYHHLRPSHLRLRILSKARTRKKRQAGLGETVLHSVRLPSGLPSCVVPGKPFQGLVFCVWRGW